MSKPKIIFISDANHVAAQIPGGVQVCTAEYLRLLDHCGFEVVNFLTRPSRSLLYRVKARLGIEVLERYDCVADFPRLRGLVKESGANLVAINQVALLGFAGLLKQALGGKIKILLLSHGNESGDFLHEVVRRRYATGVLRLRDICRLGMTIYREAVAFKDCFDVVLALSETDAHTIRWMGAARTVFIPRLLERREIGWSPILRRVGFIGTLNHRPNLDGLTALLEQLSWKKRPPTVRVVGGPVECGRALQAQFNFVEYVGQLSDDELEREAATWAVFVNPIFWYARGASTKLAIGIGWGLPIISTSPGNRGYRWQRGNLMTTESPCQMADAVDLVCGDSQRLAEMAHETRLISDSGPRLEELAGDVLQAIATLENDRAS